MPTKDDVNAYIVKRLAVHDDPKAIRIDLNTRHDIEKTDREILLLSPEYCACHGHPLPAAKWIKLFKDTRERFMANPEEFVPEMNKGVRVRMLSLAAREYQNKNNYNGMSKMLEQIAKEAGNMYTNRVELTGANGGPVEINSMSDDQLNEELVSLIASIKSQSEGSNGKGKKKS